MASIFQQSNQYLQFSKLKISLISICCFHFAFAKRGHPNSVNIDINKDTMNTFFLNWNWKSEIDWHKMKRKYEQKTAVDTFFLLAFFYILNITWIDKKKYTHCCSKQYVYLIFIFRFHYMVIGVIESRFNWTMRECQSNSSKIANGNI